ACGGSTGGGVTPGKKIAFLMPDAAPRYESQDLPLFQAKVRSMCSDCELVYRNAGGDAAVQRQQAEAALASGANVLVLDAVDTSAASVMVTAAAKRHVPVIAYDRLILNTTELAYYVSFDDATVGALQGSALLSAMKAAKLKTLPPVTGGNAELSAVQRILTGDQYMTVYRPARQEAEAAATLAYDLAFGVRVPGELTAGKTADNGARGVPAVLVQ